MITDGVISMADADEKQLALFHTMEQAPDTKPYIIVNPIDKHREQFARDDVVYKAIYGHGRTLVGFVMLVLDADQRSVEFARIVVSEKGKSYGSRAVALVDRVCTEELNRHRVWLDVFDFNPRAQHIYERNGYRFFGTTEFHGKVLKLYEKNL